MSDTRRSITWGAAAPWLLRLLWVGLVFVAGPSLSAALDDTATATRIVATAGLWVGWATGTVAAATPHALSLTALRLLAPTAGAAVLGAAMAGHPSVLAAAWAAAVLGVANSSAIGHRWVNGMAYPNETRHLLRVPAPLLAGPLVLAWALVAAAVAAGPLLLAAGLWVAGVAALAAGLPLAWILLRSIHHLSRRWVVFVPAGMVLHDPITLDVPILFTRARVSGLGLATEDEQGDGALDLTQRAAGLVLELTLDEAATLTLQSPGRRQGLNVTASRLRFAPTRPGAVLAEARRRRLT